MAIPYGGILCALSPQPAGARPRLAPRIMGLAKPSPRPGAPPQARCSAAGWNISNGGLALPEPAFHQWKPGQAYALPHIASKPPAATGPGLSRHTLAPFVPQDLPCGYSFNVGQDGSKDLKR
jgi:hypothetical protein